MQLYTGVVENRLDPLKLGRCQVRVVGLHTHDKAQLKTEDLPWAYPMQPSTSAAMSGIGFTPTGPVEGSWVIVMFRDEPDNQQPIILGAIGGIPQDFGAVDQDSDAMVLKDTDGVAKDGTGVVTDKDGKVNKTGDVGEEAVQSTTPNFEGLRPARDFSSVSAAGIALIKEFEGLKLVAYQDSVGIWTVGYGTTRIDGSPVQQNRRITQADAEKYLLDDLNTQFLPGVKSAVRTLVTQSMIDALCCFSYNLGLGNLRSSTLLKELNAGRYLDAAARFNDFNKARVNGVLTVLSGLARRRAAEKDLFLKEGIPNVAGDLSQTAQEQAPVGQGNSTGQADKGAALQLGFRDPKGKYPLYKNEPDTNRLARHEEIGKTVVFRKEAARDKGVSIANTTDTWDQSPIPYNAEYPYNHVYFSESGHVMEFDDTERSERIHVYHKSGTFNEIDANGTQVNRIVGDGYEILERNGYIHILGSQFVTIEGAQKVKVINTFDLEVDGATTINIYNNATVNISGSADLSVGENFNVRADTINLEAVSDFNIKSNGTMKVDASGNMDILSGGNMSVDYSRGDFGNGAASADASGLSAPDAVRSPTLPTINELTVITRGAVTAQTYETPEEGNPDAYRARQQEKGNLPSDEIDKGTQSDSATTTRNNVQPAGANCNLIYGMEKFTPSLVLSKHFTLGRLTSGGTRMPVSQFGLSPQEIVCNLKGLAENCLEPIIERYPNMVITNAFRRPGDVPASSKTSQHYLGQAADIVLPGFSRTEVFGIVQEIQQIIPYDQLLLEYSGTRTVWIHVSFKYSGNKQVVFTMRDHKRISNPGTFTLVA